MTDVAAVSFSSLMAHGPFARFWAARLATNAAYQMQAVAVGWQIYDLTNNPLDLGIVGLVQFLPVVGMALIIGQTVDRYDRRNIAAVCQVFKALSAIALALGTLGGWLSREAIFAILFVAGTARAFEVPTMHSLIPSLVSKQMLPRAIAASASATQTAIICGPAIGGFLYLTGAATVYLTCTAIFIAAGVLVMTVAITPQPTDKKPVTLSTLLAGFSYIWSRPVLLGAITLDLFVVLLSGVTALLPIFARDILHTGPWGLGLLRSAPAIGALAMSVALAHITLDRRVGHILFLSVGVLGLSIVVFAMSNWLVVSMAALATYGAADAISVVIRHSLIQTRTPSEMLGRVAAVNSMCTGTSSTLGEFESGVIAAWFGVIASALVGGFGAILITLLWWRLFPQIARLDNFARDH